MIRAILLGKERIESRVVYKNALLRAQLALLSGAICSIYIVIDLLNGIQAYIPLYMAGIAMSALVIQLNRKKHYLLASVILLITANMLVFLLAKLGASEGGVFFYFISTSVTSVVVLNPINKRLGMLFVALSIMLAGMAYFSKDFSIRPPDHSEVYIRISFTINFLLGLLSSVLILNFVMKRNSESEEQLMQKNEELEKINEELDRFVYSASHDMRAPLSTLLGLLNLAKLSHHPEELVHYHQKMTERIRTMEGFIKEVTNYSRNSRLEIKTSQINLRSILDEIKESFDYLAGEARVKVKIDIHPELEFYSDKERLKVILNNLVSNAIKYHDPEKSYRFVQVSALLNDAHCIIEVTDNGIGVQPEYQEKLFDMFFRASENSEGSGLGLYIVKETVQRMNGQITCRSEKHRASTFEVIIPKGVAGPEIDLPVVEEKNIPNT